MGASIPRGSTLEFDLRNTRGVGDVRPGSVTLLTEDAEGRSAETRVGVIARYHRFLTVDRTTYRIGKFRQRTPVNGSLVFRTRGDTAVLLKLTDDCVERLPDGITVDLLPVAPDAAGRASLWVADVRLDETVPEGPGIVRIDVSSDVPVKGLDFVTHGTGFQLSYESQGPFSLSQDFVSFGLVRPGNARRTKRSVEVLCRERGYDRTKMVAEVVPDEGAPAWVSRVEARLVPVEGKPALELRLFLPEEEKLDRTGAFRGTVRLDTGHSERPELEVRFSGVLRR